VPQHDLVERAGCDADGAGRGVLGNPHRSEVFRKQDFAGCDGRVHGYDVSREGGALQASLRVDELNGFVAIAAIDAEIANVGRDDFRFRKTLREP
jgi:hypothetical protein